MVHDRIVHVIDDDEAARESLEFLLRSAGIEVSTYESAMQFLQALPQVKAGCVVTDVRMPGIDGLELLRRLRSAGVRVPVIVITGHGEISMAVEAMKIGATDFLEKPFDDDILLAAVRNALSAQERSEHEDAARAVLLERLASLSVRERQVLEGLVAGSPNKVIAHDLGISPRTVEIYRANVMSKMQADSLSQLVRMALSAGIIGEQAD
ncbi:MAG TPA: response regulator FixJ [Xanthobacteraceae bacterium]|nr:response regulator FixJ [Xanthobacteraceae bacterium]